MEQIEKKSIAYSLLFFPVKWFYYLYYRRVIVRGTEKVPVNDPVIYAANHQNALMDALAILMGANRPVVFLARADIFRNKRIASILNFLRMLPVYRLRDGIDSMEKNQATFAHTARVLQSGTPLAILPEGAFSPQKRLLPLKKGVCRIAFQTAEAANFNLNVFIVPLGIDYANTRKAGTELVLQYGEPIRVADYYKLYQSDPQRAINQLRDHLAKALKTEMIHTECDADYQLVHALAGIATGRYLALRQLDNNRYNRFRAEQKLVATIGQSIVSGLIDREGVGLQVATYQDQLKRFGVKDWLFDRPSRPAIALLAEAFLWCAGVPLWLYGMAVNYLPYILPGKFAQRMKDQQFVSSVNFVGGLLLFPVWYLLLFLCCWLAGIGFGWALLLLLSWPVAGIFAFYHYKRLKKLTGKFRKFRLARFRRSVYDNIIQLRDRLIESVLS